VVDVKHALVDRIVLLLPALRQRSSLLLLLLLLLGVLLVVVRVPHVQLLGALPAKGCQVWRAARPQLCVELPGRTYGACKVDVLDATHEALA
jgi:hypothetical protein